jgi:hypothetical protein
VRVILAAPQLARFLLLHQCETSRVVRDAMLHPDDPEMTVVWVLESTRETSTR